MYLNQPDSEPAERKTTPRKSHSLAPVTRARTMNPVPRRIRRGSRSRRTSGACPRGGRTAYSAAPFFHEHIEGLPDPRRCCHAQEVGLGVAPPGRALFLRPLRYLRRHPDAGVPSSGSKEDPRSPTGLVDKTEQAVEAAALSPGKPTIRDVRRKRSETRPGAVEHAIMARPVRPAPSGADHPCRCAGRNIQVARTALLRSQEIDDPVVDAEG